MVAETSRLPAFVASIDTRVSLTRSGVVDFSRMPLLLRPEVGEGAVSLPVDDELDHSPTL